MVSVNEDPAAGANARADSLSFRRAPAEMASDRKRLADMGQVAARRAWRFDIACAEEALMVAVRRVRAAW
jgi:hypothetical protein